MTRGHIVRRYARVAVISAAACFAAYLFVIPGVSEVLDHAYPERHAGSLDPDPTPVQQIRIRAMETFTASWFFVLGGVVGSFVNVLVYRLPLGRSVVAEASACPVCGTKILMRDNLPIVGWFNLGGECRACRSPISARYPLVEFAVAAVFLLLYLVELITGATNIPGVKHYAYTGTIWMVWYTKWDVVGLYLYHCLLICSLLTWTLIDADRNRIPTRSVAMTLGLALSFPLVWPHLWPVDWLPVGTGTGGVRTGGFGTNWLHAATGLAGMLAGLLIGVALRITGTSGRPHGRDHSGSPARLLPWGFAAVGGFLGWQAAISAAVVYGLLSFLLAASDRVLPAAGAVEPRRLLPLVALVQLCLWKVLTALPASTGLRPGWPTAATLIVGAVSLAAIGSRMKRRQLVAYGWSNPKPQDFRQENA